MTVSFGKFISGSIGKAVDYDGAAGVQCVDLIKAYLNKCFGIKPGSWGDARRYYERFNDKSWGGYESMKARFTRIANTPDFVPMKGDIGVFGAGISKSHDCGHICICSGEGNVKCFYSYDQNFGSKECRLVCHRYTSEDFLGVLRPKRRVKTLLNVRTGPGTGNPVAGELVTGAFVTVYENKNGFSRIGDGRWVCTKYLEGAGDD